MSQPKAITDLADAISRAHHKAVLTVGAHSIALEDVGLTSHSGVDRVQRYTIAAKVTVQPHIEAVLRNELGVHLCGPVVVSDNEAGAFKRMTRPDGEVLVTNAVPIMFSINGTTSFFDVAFYTVQPNGNRSLLRVLRPAVAVNYSFLGASSSYTFSVGTLSATTVEFRDKGQFDIAKAAQAAQAGTIGPMNGCDQR